MDDKLNTKQENNQIKNEDFSNSTTYNFEKNSFIVEPVFKEKSADTLGTVLLRLMNSNS